MRQDSTNLFPFVSNMWRPYALFKHCTNRLSWQTLCRHSLTLWQPYRLPKKNKFLASIPQTQSLSI